MRLSRHHVALLLIFAGAGALFACGLPGSFMLDDFPNLAGLEDARRDLRRAAIYLTEGPGAAGFPARLLSYLSFYAQSASWPGNVQPFKLANIALHLLNGLLVFALARRLLAMAGDVRAAPIALAATALWLVHPIQVSTVLYVVQRMTELAALFTLAGLLAYLHGRALAARGDLRRGYRWMSASVLVCMPLAVLGKESGVLLPIFIAVLELTLLARVPRPARWPLWAGVFLALPWVVFAAYILFSGALGGFAGRHFTLPERLYTQALVLWEYLGKMALPRPRAFGLYFDDYPVAAAPWASAATAAAFAAWAAALAAAFAWRRSAPVLSFAVLWFLAAHVLESTILPLELYFEHRNYVALLGPAIGLAWVGARLWDVASSPRVRGVYATLGLGVLAALSAVTWIEARAWSDPLRLALYWGHERPGSIRAQHDLGSAYVGLGRYTDAMEVFDRARARFPGDAHFMVARIRLSCEAADVPLLPAGEAQATMAKTRLRPGTITSLDDLVAQLESDKCRPVDTAYLLGLVDALLANPGAIHGYRRDALLLKGRLHALEGNLHGAVSSLQAADRISPSLASVRLQAAWLLSADLHADALRAILQGRDDPRWKPWQRALYAPFFEGWERQVREAAEQKGVALGKAA